MRFLLHRLQELANRIVGDLASVPDTELDRVPEVNTDVDA